MIVLNEGIIKRDSSIFTQGKAGLFEQSSFMADHKRDFIQVENGYSMALFANEGVISPTGL
jgi:hypothetical protein